MTKMTKVQLKALQVAQGHIDAGNLPAFYSSVGHLARAASSQNQENALLNLAEAMVGGYRFDFRGRLVRTAEAAQ
jgi:tryptophan 2,3-dioxygenase